MMWKCLRDRVLKNKSIRDHRSYDYVIYYVYVSEEQTSGVTDDMPQAYRTAAASNLTIITRQ